MVRHRHAMLARPKKSPMACGPHTSSISCYSGRKSPWTPSAQLPKTRAPERSSARPCPGSSGVEQWTENPRVGGSIPPPGTIYQPLKRHHIDFPKSLRIFLWSNPAFVVLEAANGNNPINTHNQSGDGFEPIRDNRSSERKGRFVLFLDIRRGNRLTVVGQILHRRTRPTWRCGLPNFSCASLCYAIT